MNADEKLREILAAEAADVDPGAEGWDRIRAGVAARRRRRAWLRGGLARPAPPDAALDPTATPTPSAPSASPSAAPSPTVAPVADALLDTVWPFTQAAQVAAWEEDPGAFPFLGDPVRTAEQFGLSYLGMPNATGRRIDGTRVELARRSGGGETARVTVVTLRPEGDAWLVVRADKGEAVEIATPRPGAVVTEPLAASGPYREPDPAFQVQLRGTPDSRGTTPLVAEARAETAPPQEWSATLRFGRQPYAAGSLLVTYGSNLDGGIGGAVAIPVRFTGAASGTPVATPVPATFVGVEDGQLAVFSTGTGRPVAYLTSEQVSGSHDPSYTDDRTAVVFARRAGNCRSGIWKVGAGGGEPTNLVPADEGAASGPALTDRGLLAHAVVRCESGGEDAEIAILDTGSGAARTVAVRGQVAGRVSLRSSGRLAAYLGLDGSTAEVRYVDVSAPAPAELASPAPPGCRWTAVTMAERDRVVAAVACGASYEVRRLSLDGGSHETLLTVPERVVGLDFDGSGTHLLLQTEEDDASHVWRWSPGGQAVLVATGPLSPTW